MLKIKGKPNFKVLYNLFSDLMFGNNLTIKRQFIKALKAENNSQIFLVLELLEQ